VIVLGEAVVVHHSSGEALEVLITGGTPELRGGGRVWLGSAGAVLRLSVIAPLGMKVNSATTEHSAVMVLEPGCIS